MHPTVGSSVASHDAAPRDRYRTLALETLILAAFLAMFTIVSIGLSVGIRTAASLIGPAVHRAVVQPIPGQLPG